jgi:hypothetical protein
MSLPSIDWKRIRPLNGSRGTGFEEFCAQLAKREKPAGAQFERKGTPDAGVECYATLTNGDEWGWQAKYFDELGPSQWSQLDESIKTALEKHPKLKRYFVCVPLDRPDARIPGQKSAKQNWDERVAKWCAWAAARGLSVEFEWWGSHELIDRLLASSSGLIRYWFDATIFDASWFEARLDEAIRTAGPRYTPEVHVELPIARELEAFGRTPNFFDEIKSLAKDIRKKLQDFIYANRDEPVPQIVSNAATLKSLLERILADLAAVQIQPTGALPFQAIADSIKTAEDSAQELSTLISEQERQHSAQQSKTPDKGQNTRNPFSEPFYRLHYLSSELRQTRESLEHAAIFAGRSLVILMGEAGTGKTHLLCDVARHRTGSNRPTILLMGQRFVSSDDPWVQALRQLDLADLSAQEFVETLEIAAQSANCRALVMVDAINEGNGRKLWPDHLAAFLAHLERSPWIGVVLSVRSSYEKLVIPEAIHKRAAVTTHHGFADHEYDATRTFFLHYGLEFPSTPLIAPEFHNPLFLKTLCVGLHETGQKRLPRGFKGINAVFDLYLTAINRRLSLLLDYDVGAQLVRQALELVAKSFLGPDQRWLTQEKAASVVNALLPNRDFSRSLYHGLTVEGLLIQDVVYAKGSDHQEIVFIAYERLADHLLAKIMLDTYLAPRNPASAFVEDGPFAFLWDSHRYVPQGIIEALSIQVPERTGEELVVLAPNLMQRHRIGDAFRHSIVWRDSRAVSASTEATLKKLIRSEGDFSDTLDALLTVSTLPDHPLNARYLHGRLRRFSMPDRDAGWSIYLHRAIGEHGAVDRLIDWASGVKADAILEDETVDLCSIALAWMLTSSNRFLRDRATKALISLLTGRIDATIRLTRLFAVEDDLYVSERIYAICYGVAMRSNDPAKISALADVVNSAVFSGESPVPHLLLRDYARGVIERALVLNPSLNISPERFRPPYGSKWPKMPSAKDIRRLLPNWSTGSYDSGETSWARNRIGSSVMSDDFASYVIGTNSGRTHWLSLRLTAKPWKSPDERIASVVAKFSSEERSAWDEFQKSEQQIGILSLQTLAARIRISSAEDGQAETANAAEQDISAEDKDLEDLILEEQVIRNAAIAKLETALTKAHLRALNSIWNEKSKNGGRPPKFDLRLIQRYILWRVFDLGWTVERFGKFDRYLVQPVGRDAAKPERIGKKYQWIALHEILALIADNFQYREEFREDTGDQQYEGPWQDFYRDIDPSCTLRKIPGGTSWHGHRVAWWGPTEYKNWDEPANPQDWATNYNDLPKIESLLSVSRPSDQAKWLNLDGYFNWEKEPPSDREYSEIERRELWYICTGYLIHRQDVDKFLKWAEAVDFWGKWMPDAPEVHRMFLGEYGWSPAFKYFSQPYYGDDSWTQPGHGCPVKIRTASFEYIQESRGFDCSVDDGYTFRLPVIDLVAGQGLRWSGQAADYVDPNGRLAAFDPTAHEEGPTALLVREDILRDYLDKNGLSICWVVLGEKRVIEPGYDPKRVMRLRLSGAYSLGQTGPSGFLKCLGDRTDSADSPEKVIATIRT